MPRQLQRYLYSMWAPNDDMTRFRALYLVTGTCLLMSQGFTRGYLRFARLGWLLCACVSKFWIFMRFVVYAVMTHLFTATSTSAKIAMVLSQCFFVITFCTRPLIWTVDFFFFFFLKTKISIKEFGILTPF